MTLNTIFKFSVAALLVGLIGCAEPQSTGTASPTDRYMKKIDTSEPGSITVQHCLISFNGGGTSKPVTRSLEEARALANELLAKAKAGEDFDALVKANTDDAHPGIYNMVNFGRIGNTSPALEPEDQIFERGSMVAAFGDVGFKLEVGEIGMSDYSKSSSPYGFHIIKRLK